MSSKIKFDSASRAFIKKIKARPPLPPPPELNRKLTEHNFTAIVENGDLIRVTVTEKELQNQGWRRG